MIDSTMIRETDERDEAASLKLLVVLARAHASVTAHLHAQVGQHDLTLTEFGILEVLFHKGAGYATAASNR